MKGHRLSSTLQEERLSVINITLLSAALVIFLNSYFVLRVPALLIVLLSAGFTVLLHFFFNYKSSMLTYCILGGVLLGILILNFLWNYPIIDGLRQIYSWILSYDGESINYNRRYGFLTVAGLQFLACLLFYLFHKIKYSKNFLAVLLPVFLVFLAVRKADVPKITILIILSNTLLVISEVCGRKFSKERKREDGVKGTLYLVPFCLIIAILSVSLPSKPEPIKWQGIKNLIQCINRQGTVLMTKLEYLFDGMGTEFSLRYSGYDEESGELGGNIQDENKISLIIKTKKESTAKGYLIGAVSDIYTGRKWEKSTIELELSNEEYVYDYYELLRLFTKAKEAGMDTKNLVQKRSYTIEYNDLKTRSLFYPLKTINLPVSKRLSYKETPQGGILFDKAKGIGTKYEVKYYELNLESNQLKQLLIEANKYNKVLDMEVFSKDIETEAVKVFYHDYIKSGLNTAQMEAELKTRADFIKRQYTQLPKELPQRVYLLAKKITKNKSSDYEKLKAIEGYLNTLTYTTNMKKTPNKEDFVDYFLFQQKKGYCTYFATAMGVLARCAGIPTRYVEGFVVDYELKEKEDTYKVRSSSAHSWVEAYIKGAGWIPFEPTPSFRDLRYTQWKEKGITDTPRTEDYYLEEVEKVPAYYQNTEEELNKEYFIDDKISTDVRTNQQKSHLLIIVIISTGVVIVSASVFLLYYRILINKYRQKLKKASGNEKLFLLFQELLRYLRKEGYRLLPGETLNDFSERVGKRICYDNIVLSDVSEIFMKVRYGNYEVSKEELSCIIIFLDAYKNDFLKKQGKVKMFFDRFLYLHFSQ